MKIFDLYIRILKKQIWLYAIYLMAFWMFIVLASQAGKGMTAEQALVLYYRYAVPVLMVLIMLSISSVTAVTSDVELSMRHKAAPVRLEILELAYLGADLLVMLFWWMLFLWTAVVLYGEAGYGMGGLLMALNLLTVSVLSTALGFMTGIFTKSVQGRAITSNLMAFLLPVMGGGQESLKGGENTAYLLRSFTPIFWYQKVLEELTLTNGHMSQQEWYNYAVYIGIQMVFALAVLAFGMMLDKQRKESTN